MKIPISTNFMERVTIFFKIAELEICLFFCDRIETGIQEPMIHKNLQKAEH